MINDKDPSEGVKIYAPDRSLQIKIGVQNLDQVFSASSVQTAQNLIEQSSDTFMEESLELMKDLHESFKNLTANPKTENQALAKVIDDAFLIKTKTGVGGYTLISNLAKSLQLNAEGAQKEGLTGKTMEVLGWHVHGLDQFMRLRIKGNGGDLGEAIMNEIMQLPANQIN